MRCFRLFFALTSFLLAKPLFAQTFTDRTTLLSQPYSFFSTVAVAVADVNNDGKDDIVRLMNGTDLNVEYQQGSGQDFNHQFFGTTQGEAWALAVADYNNDGYSDLFFAGQYDGAKFYTATNNGLGFQANYWFGEPLFAQGSNFADINNDGWLDVFSCHDDGLSKIWGNNGSGGFDQNNNWINMATTPPSNNSGNYGSVWSDFDNDGNTDLYIAKCRQSVNDPTDPRRINALFVNNGNGTYSEAAGTYGLKIGWQSWTADFQDIDNDGDFDCLVTNHDYNLQLLRNDGTGHFTDISTEAGLSGLTEPYLQGIMRDFDNDGFVDILVARPCRLLHNNGSGTFTSVSVPFPNFATMATGDLNHDGFLDLYGGYPWNILVTSGSPPDQLWMNNGNTNHFLAVQLDGTQSNRKGVGARVELHGPWGKQVREIRAGESYGISNSLTAHFGLGAATQINYLVVHWPSSTVDVVANPAADQYLTIVEGSTNFCGSLAINATPTPADIPPDAVATDFSIGCANASVEGSFTLKNEGSSSLPSGLPVAFYLNDPRLPGATLLDVVQTNVPVPINGSQSFDFQLNTSLLPGMGSHAIYLVANDNGSSALPLSAAPGSFTDECDLGNNFRSDTLEIQSLNLDLGPDLNRCDVAVELDAGNGFSSYLWQDGSTAPVFTAMQSGSYSVTVMDGCGLQQTDTVQVALNFAPLFINLGDVYTACPGDTVWLNVPDDFSYDSIVWQPQGIVACDTCLSTFAVVQQTTSFTLQAFKGACFSHGNLGVYVNDAPTVSLVALDGSCGDAATITATPLGTGPFNYAWSNANGTIGQNTATIYPQASGSYTVTVSDMYGCQATGSASVQVGEVAQVSASLDPPTCAVSTDGGIALTVSGGNAPFSFLWSNGATTQNLPGIAEGSYSVTLTDVNQCITVASYTLQSPPALELANYANNIACHGGTTTLSTQAWGGTPPYSFVWSNGETTSISYGQPAGTYSVTVTDAHQCTATAISVLTAPPAIAATAEVLPISCSDSTPGQVTISTEGGAGQYSYLWPDGSLEAVLTTMQPGSYSVTITDGDGCTAVASAMLPLSQSLNIAGSQTAISCHPSNGNSMDGSVAVTVSGGAGNFAFLWENGETAPALTGLGAGDYTVTVTDGIGCSGYLFFSLVEPLQMDVVAQSTNGSCDGQASGTATATVANGGMEPYSFHWSNTQTGPLATGLGAGLYTVTATDGNGCTATSHVEIPLLQNDTTTLALSFCQGESSPLTGTEYPDPGNFLEQLLLSNAQGCDSVVLAEVTVHPEEWIWADNGPLPYGTEYHGVILTQDTQFILYDTTQFGCLLTISENVTVSPSATKEASRGLGLLAYPSPFTDRLHLRFTLPRPVSVSIALHDALGRQAKVWVVGQQLNGGEHQLYWETADLPPGIYLLRVWADGLAGGRMVVKAGAN